MSRQRSNRSPNWKPVESSTGNGATSPAGSRKARTINDEIAKVPHPTIAITLPPMEPGTGAVIRQNPDGSTSVEIVRFRAGWSKAEVAGMFPGIPHTDTVSAQIERAGVKIGFVGRTPVLSEQQIQAAFGLRA